MKKLFLILLIGITFQSSLFAMGDRERGAFMGAAGVILLTAILNDREPVAYVEQPRRVYYYEEPVYYVQPRPVYIQPEYRRSYYPDYRHNHRDSYYRGYR